MAKIITNKNMYRDLMKMDGAKMRDLNPKSKIHYAAAVTEPIVKTGAKVVGIAALASATGIGIMSCDDKPKTPDPITCDCPDEATHLEVGANNVDCPADKCPHTGDCTEKVNEMLGNGTTKIVKSVGFDVDAFNSMISNFNNLANSPNEAVKNSFKNNVTEVRILTGSNISHQGNIVSVGSGANWGDVATYLLAEGVDIPRFFGQ